jgi:glucokinase
MRRPVQRQRAPREAVAAIIGAEAGIGVGLLIVGNAPLAPLALGVAGAAIGAGAVHMRNTLVRRWLRAQLRGAR